MNSVTFSNKILCSVCVVHTYFAASAEGSEGKKVHAKTLFGAINAALSLAVLAGLVAYHSALLEKFMNWSRIIAI